ncbi:MAG: hypothetical protein SGI90_13045 [Candidatus Eisenbacteria bacterium]|nr:hypothetical protein [Candidatus Eisenbacteria bacterium]
MIPVILTVLLGAAGPAGAQLVNPGFDAGPAGPMFNFGTVVGPPAQYGFWGAEDASIVTVNTCGLGPRSNPYMLQLNVGGGSHSQAWQAVDVSAGPPTLVSLRAWGNTCALSPGATIGVDIRTFNSPNGWPTHTLLVNNVLGLDADAGTWQQVVVNCVAIPVDTKYILAQVFLVNSTAGGVPAYIDDVELIFDHCPTPIEGATWSRIKSLTGSRSQ